MDIEILLDRLAKPAQRAILSTGVTSLEELSALTEGEIASMHGIGQNALIVILSTLKEHGLTLAKKPEERSA